MNLPKQKLLPQTGFSGNKTLFLLKDSVKETLPVVLGNESLINSVIAADPERGFEMIFRAYYSQLCSHALRFVYSTFAAEDIVGDVFFDFWRKELYRTVTTSYRTYLYAAVRNRSLNYLKAEFGNKITGIDAGNQYELLTATDNPHSIMLLDELVSKLNVTVNGFPPMCQRVFLLSRVEGKKNREIAEQLQINIKTVEAHMMKALAMLKKSLAEYLE